MVHKFVHKNTNQLFIQIKQLRSIKTFTQFVSDQQFKEHNTVHIRHTSDSVCSTSSQKSNKLDVLSDMD